ncbi:ATP-binding protein [Methylomonas sp. 11b]|uniref:ATP-binding protein n=1 Tax=Methylomonas sp. 11b TaxID=1168169 RepID=UPI0018CC0F68|nr:ATP-binding protein [Methylomonas sp. 11b]
MKLVSLQIFPSGQFGWKSDLLTFGKDITQLYGPNGCGKTPLVQTITYCLGYPSIFRNDIYDHCNYAILMVDTPKGILKIKRVYSKDVDIEVTDPNNNIQRFFDEKEYSLFFVRLVRL